MRRLSCGLLLAGLVVLALPPASGRADDFKVEAGFTLLFNGKDLTGWKTEKGGEALDQKTEAYGKRFTVVDGKIVIDPKIKGDAKIETAKTFGKDVHIKFDYLPGKGCNNDLYIRGIKFDITPKGVKNLKEDSWNEFEIIIAGDKAEFKNNGESQRVAKPSADATTFKIRAEFGSIEFRRIRAKE